MTDHEMLEKAAQAAGLKIIYWAQDDYPVVQWNDAEVGWCPLKFNSDALDLAVRLEMDLFVRAGRWTEAVRPMGAACKEPHGVDAAAATRKAIVRAAFEDAKPAA